MDFRKFATEEEAVAEVGLFYQIDTNEEENRISAKLYSESL